MGLPGLASGGELMGSVCWSWVGPVREADPERLTP